MVNLKIDGKDVQVEKEATILEAAEKIGIKIPTLCYLKKVSPTGACRVCVVEIEGIDTPQTACNTKVSEGIVVTTQSERLTTIRRQVVELLLVNHPLDCPVCDAAGECELQDICFALGVTSQPFAAENVNPEDINGWPLVQQVPSRCILCEKCVKVCHEVVGSSALFVNDRGDRTFIDKDLSKCEFCGNCVSTCPTGTMISKTTKFAARPWELNQTASVCTLCGSHCQMDINTRNGSVVRVTSEDGVNRNGGNLCVGGFFGHSFIKSPNRLLKPSIRMNGTTRTATWDEALNIVADRLGEINKTDGADAIAGLTSARLTNEENYLFQKLFRAAIGSNNIDSEARFGALGTAQTLQKTLGLKGASAPLSRIGEADAVLVFGSDVTAEAPAIDWQIQYACRKKDSQLIVANMRKVKLSSLSHCFLNYRPGTEVTLANALCKILLDKKLADDQFLKEFVKNSSTIKTHLKGVKLDAACEATGVCQENLERAAELLGNAKAPAIVFGADVAKSDQAQDKVSAVVNLALVTGALNKGGLFPVDEKGNMQGLLDSGAYPEALPGYQEYSKAKSKFESAWQTTLPQGGRDAVAILEGIEKGEVKALYLVGTNPLVSFPENARWRKALEKVNLLVVQDILSSDLTDLAHVVLPGSSFVEKTGSVTALDNQVSFLAQAIRPHGEARADLEILGDVYNRLSEQPSAISAEALLQEMNELTDLYQTCTTGKTQAQKCTKAPYSPAKGQLLFSSLKEQPAQDKLQLLSGKILFHFGTTTTFADGMQSIAPEGYIEINPSDASAASLADGCQVKVTSSVGTAQGKIRISEAVPKGLLFAPYHFGDINIQQIIPQNQNRVAVQISKA